MPKAKEDLIGGRLSEIAFETLLRALDPDRDRAGEKYLELSSKLRRLFAWRGCRETISDKLVDETLDRVAHTLVTGTVIENLNAYSLGVARNVWREELKKPQSDLLSDIASPETPEDADRRFECLEKCLATLSSADRELILAYYDVEENDKIKHSRKRLAERLGKSSGALKVSATRLRDKLEKCINNCLAS